jgi:hypothetical protein
LAEYAAAAEANRAHVLSYFSWRRTAELFLDTVLRAAERQ